MNRAGRLSARLGCHQALAVTRSRGHLPRPVRHIGDTQRLGDLGFLDLLLGVLSGS
jgi:hypothetical protein